MFAKVSDGVIVKTSDGSQKMREYGWRTLRELSRAQRVADGWYDMLTASWYVAPLGFVAGSVYTVIDTDAGTVSELRNPDTPLDASGLAAAMASERDRLAGVVQAHLDEKAREFRYDNMHSACGWSGSFPDATALKEWGAYCWARAGQIEAEVAAQTRAIPTDAALIELLPVFALP